MVREGIGIGYRYPIPIPIPSHTTRYRRVQNTWVVGALLIVNSRLASQLLIKYATDDDHDCMQRREIDEIVIKRRCVAARPFDGEANASPPYR
jgi:hypothetical protein